MLRTYNILRVSVSVFVVSGITLFRVAPKNGTVDTVDFQDFALINSSLFSPCLIEHLFPHYNNTKIIKFG